MQIIFLRKYQPIFHFLQGQTRAALNHVPLGKLFNLNLRTCSLSAAPLVLSQYLVPFLRQLLYNCWLG